MRYPDDRPRADAERTDHGDRRDRVRDAVVERVAAVTGIDPLDLEPLYRAVDSGALNALFRRRDDAAARPVTVHFTLQGCEVIVHGGGEVTVIPPMDLEEAPTPLATTE